MNTKVQISDCSTADVESFAVEGKRANVVSSFVGDRYKADFEGDGPAGDAAPNAGESPPGDGQNNASEVDEYHR